MKINPLLIHFLCLKNIQKAFRIMKISFFILFVCACQLFAVNTEAQNAVIELNSNKISIEELFKEIEKQTDYLVIYSTSDLRSNFELSLTKKKAKVSEYLEEALAGHNLKYEFVNNYIILSSLEIKKSQQDKKQLQGTVYDQNGEPVIGANVIEKGTHNGTVTDIDGKFSLTIGKNSSLEITFIGYLAQSVTPKDNTINIYLKEDLQTLDEVVVVGYGVQKKVNVIGAVAAVNSESIGNRPVTNISNAIQGLLPGVSVTSDTGQPGRDNPTLRVRGTGTLNNSNPMYVVDGMPVSGISDIDPNDIESLSVLKDASSAAIYGSRAANGVILITTKKGTERAPRLKYDGYVGWQNAISLPEYLSSAEYAELYNKALIYEGKAPRYTTEEIALFKNGSDPDNYPDTDWHDLFYKTGFMQNHRAEISGGNGGTSYMFSVGYLGQDGIVKNSEYDRYTVRGNVNSKISNVITAGVNLSFMYGDMKEPISAKTGSTGSLFTMINTIAPFVPYKYSNGYYGYNSDGNPISNLDINNINNEKWYSSRAVGNITYEPIKGLKLQENVGFEYKANVAECFKKDQQFYNWKTGSPSMYIGPNSQTDERNNQLRVNLQTLINYNKTFGSHDIGIMGGFEQEYTRYDWTKGYRINFLNNDLWELNAGSPDGQQASGSAYEIALRSFFGRLSYIYDNRYLLELNIRRDGTSRIAQSTRWGNFPSFSAAWRIINESFMEGTRGILSDLKLRGGWGRLGNQAISNYPYQSVLAQKNYALGGSVYQGVAPVDGANKNIKWETTETINLGLDVAFLSNQFVLSVDAYKKKTYDILMKLPVSPLYGLSAPYQNAGEVHNTGVELQLGYKYAHKDWTVDVTANTAYNKNEIVDLKNNGARIWNGYKFLQEGYSIDSYGGFIVDGIFQNEEEVKNNAVINRANAGPGDFKYRDVKEDGVIDAEDRVYLGCSTPKWIFGLNLSATWKNLDASVFFQGAADVKGFLHSWAVGELMGDKSKPSSLYRDAWDAETNPDGKFPRPLSSWSQNSSVYYNSSFWMRNASYLRLKNLQIGYTIPKEWLNILNIEKVRFYYSGQNMLTITKYPKGFDPERTYTDGGSNPLLRAHTFGVNIVF